MSGEREFAADTARPSANPVYLDVATPGILESLTYRPAPPRDVRAGEIALEVHAAGLNFSDVLKAMGLYPGVSDHPVPLGVECAGTVLRLGEGVSGLTVGQEIIAVAPYSFSTITLTAPYLIVPKPAHLSYAEAATIPITFLTAHYALHHLGHMAPGERILIHAAAGGVGLAAIQLAQRAGAEIFATVGSPEKRAHLEALGVRHIFSSRSLEFADEIMARTDGKGVDLVLNSLAGEFIPKSLGVLGAYGRFLEIGKIDIYQNKALGLLPFQNNLSYFAIDMDRLFRQRPDLSRQLFAEVIALFEQQALRPLPYRLFPRAEVAAAFRYMAQRKNIGKIVVAVREEGTSPSSAPVPQAEPAAEQLNGSAHPARDGSENSQPAAVAIRDDGSYLITGGLGDLGLLVAGWLVEQGGRNLILVGRRGADETSRPKVNALEKAGARVAVAKADVADAQQLATAVAEAGRDLPPLRGVVHAAGVLDDGLLVNLDRQRFDRVLAPKVQGAWNLHTLTRDQPLDFFVLFSSVASAIGSPGQGNYAAANAFLDALAHQRRALGLPCLTINWGPWAEVGMAAQGNRRAHMEQFGIQFIGPQAGLGVLEQLLPRRQAQVVVLAADWPKLRQSYGGTRQLPLLAEVIRDVPAADNLGSRDIEALKKLFAVPAEEREAQLTLYFQTQLARVMGLEQERIDPQQPLSSIGLDSLMGLELVNRIQMGLGVNLPMELLVQGPSLAQLAAHVVGQLKEPGPEDAAAAPVAPVGQNGTALTLPQLNGHAAAPAHTLSNGVGQNGDAHHATPPAGVQTARPPRVTFPERRYDPRAYGTSLRPQLVRWLEALGLDKTYLRAEGDRLWYDADGTPVEVLDFLGGYGSTLFGHNHPELVAYARTLLEERVPVHAQTSRRTAAGMLARALSDQLKAATGRDYVAVLVNTGTEAIEAAIKHAVLEQTLRAQELRSRDARITAQLAHLHHRGRLPLPEPLRARLRDVLGHEPPPDLESIGRCLAERNEEVYGARPLFLAVQRAFHGKTTGSLDLTANPQFREPFARIAGLRTAWLPPEDAAALHVQVEAEVKLTWGLRPAPGGGVELVERPWCNVAGLFVEPVQGEGGVHILDRAFLAEVQAAAAQHGFPVVADEIQCGLGRCGTFTASEQLGLRAGYYAFAKSLGGGLAKVAALLVERDRYRREFDALHTSTFAEDDLSCLLSLKALELLRRDGLAARCAARGAYLQDRLLALQERHPRVIRAVRGLGLIAGVELSPLSDSMSDLIRTFAENEGIGYLAAGYLLYEERLRVGPTLSHGNTLRLEPSAYVSEADLDRGVAGLDRLCEVLERANAARFLRFGLDTGPASGGDEPVNDWQRGRLRDAAALEPLPGEPQVAFLIHYLEPEDLLIWEPSLSEVPRESLDLFFRKALVGARPFVAQQTRIQTGTGATVHLRLISFTLTSAMIKEAIQTGETDWIMDQIHEAVDMARRAGCTVVGFGGYLSIVSHNCQKAATARPALTTGNSLTVGVGVEAIRAGCRGRGIDLAQARLALVGATGNICSTYARIIADDVPEVVLIGRSHAEPRLAEVAHRLYADAWERIVREPADGLTGLARAIRETAAVRELLAAAERARDVGRWLYERLRAECGDRFVYLATDLSALRQCNVVVTASNAAAPILLPEHLAAGPVVVCDLAVPADVAPAVAQQRPDVLVLRGGVIRLPHNLDFTVAGMPLPPGHMFACMAETTLLGAAGCDRHFSFGPIDKTDVQWIMGVARQHGYQLGDVQVERSF
jgi:acetylornithine/succinyldiaminopimelate/putrescine aminotransferase/NADPH:quinone reductase-like Zn-dependent oxidoreductase/predicted amino acid dehydrogenase/acyl carrier protein